MYMYFFFAILFSIANMYLMIAPYFVSIYKKLLVNMIFFSFYMININIFKIIMNQFRK